MKLPENYRTAVSLKKEYDRIMKYANRLDAPKIEREYYLNAASNTASYIDWELLERGPSKEKYDKYQEYME